MGFDSLQVHANFAFWVLLLLFLILAAYSWYVYRYTVPEVPRKKKILLSFLRMSALMLLIFIIAEPVVTVVKKIAVKPFHAVFIDRSQSVQSGAAAGKNVELIRAFLEQKMPGNTGYYTFAENVKKISEDSLRLIAFDGRVTGFSGIYNEIRAMQEVPASITILSDGIANEGTDPTFTAERSGIPVFSVVVGDSSKKRDVIVMGIEAPENFVAGTQYVLRAQVMVQGLHKPLLTIRLKEEQQVIEEKRVAAEEGFNAIAFTYIPKTAGEKKLVIEVDSLNNEQNYNNNSSSRFVQVKNSKVKVLIVAGSPSADYTFVRNALSEDTNLVVRSIVELGVNKFLAPYSEKMLDSCSMYFFVGYPSVNSSTQLFNQILNRVRDNQKSFFLLLDEWFSPQMVEQLSDYLPAKIRKNAAGSLAVQAVITSQGQRHSIMKAAEANGAAFWSDLPPVLRANVDIAVKPEAETMLTCKIGNTSLGMPLLVSRAFGKQRSVLLAAKDIWRWQLNAKNSTGFFSTFILHNFTWINAGGERERLSVNTTKKIYSKGERVVLHAELFDESYNLLSDEQIDLEVRNGKDVARPVFSQIGSGLYEASFDPAATGDYTFTASYKEEGKKPLLKTGRFAVSDQNIELVNLEADYQFLAYLAQVTGGKAYYNTFDGYLQEIQKINNRGRQDKTEIHEFVLRNIPLLAGLIILLLAIEWFIRKRAGML